MLTFNLYQNTAYVFGFRFKSLFHHGHVRVAGEFVQDFLAEGADAGFEIVPGEHESVGSGCFCHIVEFHGDRRRRSMDNGNGGESRVALFQGFLEGYSHPFAAAAFVGVHLGARDHVRDRGLVRLADDLFADVAGFCVVLFDDHVQQDIDAVPRGDALFVPLFKMLENFGLADHQPLIRIAVAKRDARQRLASADDGNGIIRRRETVAIIEFPKLTLPVAPSRCP